jgi:hypothetical protein
MDAPDDQDVFLKFNFTHRFGYEVIIRSIDVTRFQRAPKVPVSQPAAAAMM